MSVLVLTMSRRMLSNLDQGLDADGAVILGSDAEERRAVGLRVWRDRERQLLYSLVNCCVLHQVMPCRMRVLFKILLRILFSTKFR